MGAVAKVASALLQIESPSLSSWKATLVELVDSDNEIIGDSLLSGQAPTLLSRFVDGVPHGSLPVLVADCCPAHDQSVFSETERK